MFAPVGRRHFVALALAWTGAPAARAAEALNFAELYDTVGILGTRLSAKAQALNGQPVVLRGYMAPPLKPQIDFFVLTRNPAYTCPFCDSAAEWPDDIVVVKLRRGGAFVGPEETIEVAGRLDLGARTDLETGFVSLVRVIDAAWRKV